MAETKFYLKVVDQATGPIKTVKNEFQGLFASVKGMTGAMASFQGMIAFYMSGMLVRNLQQFGQAFTDTASKFENMQRRFKALGAPDYTNAVIGFAKDNPIMGIENTQNAFVKLYSVGIDPTSKALQSLADAGNAFALSEADMGGVMKAITQIAGKGVVSLEELRGQLAERIPTAIKIMARELGYGDDNLKIFFKDIEQGRISAQNGLTALFDGMSKDYAKSTQEMQGTWTWLISSMNVEWELFKKEFMSPEVFQKVKDMITELFNIFRDNKDFIKDVLTDMLWLIEKTGDALKILVSELQAALHLMKSIGNIVASTKHTVPASVKTFAGYAMVNMASDSMDPVGKWLRNTGLKLLKSGEASENAAKPYLNDGMKEFNKAVDAFERVGQASRKLVGMKTQTTPEVTVSATRLPNDKPIFFPGRGADYEPSRMTTYGDWTEPGKMEKMRQGFKMTIGAMIGDFKAMFDTFEKIGAYAAKTISEAMANSFNDFFIDAMEGRLKQFKDYLLGFFKEIGAAISRLLSQYLAQQLLGAAMSSAAGPVMGPSTPGQAAEQIPTNIPIMDGMLSKARGKATSGGATSTPSIQIINNSGTPLQGSASTQTNDIGETIMVIVLDAVGRNKGGSRDMLRGMLAT